MPDAVPHVRNSILHCRYVATHAPALCIALLMRCCGHDHLPCQLSHSMATHKVVVALRAQQPPRRLLLMVCCRGWPHRTWSCRQQLRPCAPWRLTPVRRGAQVREEAGRRFEVVLVHQGARPAARARRARRRVAAALVRRRALDVPAGQPRALRCAGAPPPASPPRPACSLPRSSPGRL
jgi:hypothetical protein